MTRLIDTSLHADEVGVEVVEARRKKAEREKAKQKSGCACGRTVCCGKHKNGQCACQKKGRVRE